MLFVQDITTGAAVSRLAPTRTDMIVPGGVVVWVSVWFPPGSQGTLKCRVVMGDTPIFPRNAGTWLSGDGQSIEWNEYIKTEAGANRLTIFTYNDDTSFSHLIQVRVNILPEWLADPRKQFRGIDSSLSKLLKMIGVA